MSIFRCFKRWAQVRDTVNSFATCYVLTVSCCYPLAKTPCWRTTSCWLSTTAYSIHSHVPSIPENLLLHPQVEDAPCCCDWNPGQLIAHDSACNTMQTKGKGMLSVFSMYGTKVYRGSKGIATLIPTFGTRRKWATSRPDPRGKNLLNPFNRKSGVMAASTLAWFHIRTGPSFLRIFPGRSPCLDKPPPGR